MLYVFKLNDVNDDFTFHREKVLFPTDNITVGDILDIRSHICEYSENYIVNTISINIDVDGDVEISTSCRNEYGSECSNDDFFKFSFGDLYSIEKREKVNLHSEKFHHLSSSLYMKTEWI